MDNKQIVLGLSEAIQNGDWEIVNTLLDDNFEYYLHDAPVMNKEAYIGFMRGVLASAMTDMDMKFYQVLEDGNFVSFRYENMMTHTGEFNGIPATNKRVLTTGMVIREVENGKIIREWQSMDTMGLLQKLGVMG